MCQLFQIAPTILSQETVERQSCAEGTHKALTRRLKANFVSYSLLGVRQDNQAATRQVRHGHGQKGYAFFREDEDEFGLGDVLQALCFKEQGEGGKLGNTEKGFTTYDSD